VQEKSLELWLPGKPPSPDLAEKKRNNRQLVMVAVLESLIADWAARSDADIICAGNSLGTTLCAHLKTLAISASFQDSIRVPPSADFDCRESTSGIALIIVWCRRDQVNNAAAIRSCTA
jgi:hypothetical protein